MTRADVPQMSPAGPDGDPAGPAAGNVPAGRDQWGGWGSNPRPADYEKYAR